jgi:DNA-binding response OmpR family regulator
MRILLVEDHPPLAEAIGDALGRAGFTVDLAGSIAEAREATGLADYDLALLDLGLPDGSGTVLLGEWRAAGGPPVIVLTARGALGDRIEGLNGGADDYVVKPVQMPELVARCRAVLRRPGNRASMMLEAGAIRFDTVHREAHRGETPLNLGRRETGVLELLMRRKNRVVPRRILLDALYEREAEVTPNAVDAAVSRLRRRLQEVDAGVALQTVRGVGWLLADEAEG